ncbi:unnamed protein product [Rotaria sp. Silwood1]|nr:unnamed protein product [Rotaria sp. Silwood1]
MTKLIKKNLTTYNDSYYGDFSLDVPRLSRHAAQRATERKIPAVELLRSKSHINAYIDKVVSKTGVVITAYPRVQGGNRNYELPENGRRYTFPKDGIGLFIGKEHANIKRIQAEYQLKELYFDSYDVKVLVKVEVNVFKAIKYVQEDQYVCIHHVFCGTQCQFSVNGFRLSSLDAILGYLIQPTIVLFSLTVTIVGMFAELIGGILSLITFNNTLLCQVGCGWYLFGSSIITLLTTVIMDQWLNACVAMERAIAVSKGINFNKKKSKRIAKIVISILSIFVVSANIYDALYRRLIDEDNEDDKRIRCIIATYPSRLQTYSSFIHIFHFCRSIYY